MDRRQSLPRLACFVEEAGGRHRYESWIRPFNSGRVLRVGLERHSTHALTVGPDGGTGRFNRAARCPVRPLPRANAGLCDRPVDLLINNAAQGAPHAALGAIEADGVLNALDVTVAGPLRLVQCLLPNLLRATDPIIVTVTSRLASLAAQATGDFAELSTSYAYKISKAGQDRLTVSLAQDLQGRVRCWAVHPGKLATGMGQTDASKDPRAAASQLRELVDSNDRASPRFCSLGEPDLHW